MGPPRSTSIADSGRASGPGLVGRTGTETGWRGLPPTPLPARDRAGDSAEASPAHVGINMVEGRGIWVDVSGELVDGSLSAAVVRFDRLAELGFGVVVVDTRPSGQIDRTGTAMLAHFVERILASGGQVIVVDSDESPHFSDGDMHDGTLTLDAPDGTWWSPEERSAP